MNWVEKWKALAARIDGVAEAGKYSASIFTIKYEDSGAIIRNTISPELLKINQELSNRR